MNRKAIILLLQELSYFPLVQEQILKRSILFHFKEKRKGLTKEEIQEKGYNIYDRIGTTFDSLMTDLLQNRFAEVIYENQEKKFGLTQKGRDYLLSLYTNNHCEEFLLFEQAVNKITENRNETNFNPVHIAAMYYSNKSLSYVEEAYSSNRLQDEVQEYHDYLLTFYDIKPGKDDFLLHITPKLFLQEEDISEPVEFYVKGITLPMPIILERPYPNKRYVVAGAKKGREKVTGGFYLNLGNKESLPDNKEIRFLWSLGNGKEIIHDIQIDFQVDRGNLFSTEQSLSRSNSLPSIKLTTFIDEDLYIKKGRSIERTEREQMLYIKESVTLTSFPMRLHSSFYADASYKKWRDNRRK